MTTLNLVALRKGRWIYTRSPIELSSTNDLTTGQCFFAVAEIYKKRPKDYRRWVSYSKHPGEWSVIDTLVQSCENDLEKINTVCRWLSEDEIE